MLLNYWIQPRQTFDGFSLDGDLLPWGGWYRKLDQAIGYAEWHGRPNTTMISIRDFDGNNLQLRIIFGDGDFGLRPMGCTPNAEGFVAPSLKEIRISWE